MPELSEHLKTLIESLGAIVEAALVRHLQALSEVRRDLEDLRQRVEALEKRGA